MTPLPDNIKRLEQTMGQFTAALAVRLPEDLRTPVAFCSPASFREPEIDNCWHPYLIQRGFVFFFISEMPKFLRSWAGGIRRLMKRRFGQYTFLPREGALVLGMTPRSICTVRGESITTNYCHPEDTSMMNWLILDETREEAGGYPLSRWKIATMALTVFAAWARVSFFHRRMTIDWLVASFLALRWILGFQWAIQWMWELKVREELRVLKPRKIFCTHEMHPWARIVWSEAALQHIPTLTFEHATCTRTKLWFFPTRDELDAGFQTPNEFVVFSLGVQQLLTPFFPSATRFRIGCGPRYAHWKERFALKAPPLPQTAPLLFVSSIPWWDNDVVLEGAATLLRESLQRPIRVRLHPIAVVPKRWRRWLQKMRRCRILELSTSSLQEDILQSSAIIGMNTTVLEEAAVMGRAVIVLATQRYLSFSTSLGIPVRLEELNREVVERAIAMTHSRRDSVIKDGCEALGIHRPIARVDA